MKRVIAAAAFAVGLAGTAAADPVYGVWKTQEDDGAYAHVKVSKCGSTICGVISRTFNASGEYKSENIGKKLFWGISPNGGGSYSGGRVWQPSTGKEYGFKFTVSGNTMKAKGCLGPICPKTQTWSKVQ